MLAREAKRLADLAKDVATAKAYVCDVSDPSQVDASMDMIERELGAPAVLIHNAVGGGWGNFMDIDPAMLNRNFQVNTMGLLYLARRVAPEMVASVRAPSSSQAIPRRTAAGRITRVSHPQRRRNASCPRRWHANWVPTACTSPTSSSML